ncbi:flagellar hook-length control protein FliK [Lysobacter auxotrophicus]|uniref:Flagellar hook-length control protein FliK n=1 Tax=Lysobacter auxotrophicus TaxID=2992573 RepID=A0ABM8DGZ0_9GAMM|nr:flagellar hook-length control protein FliK [Lysobacter auxotrophicus]BDU17856.1 flagellar hook-length control protein FliK [Lysobacter auxotrophicus]
MQAFDALFGGQRAGSARDTSSGPSRVSNAHDDANASGGFDRMLQGARGATSSPASRTTDASTQAKQNEAKPRDAGAPRASEDARSSDESKSAEARPKDDARDTTRAESRDDAPRETAGAKDEADASASTTDEAAPAGGDTNAATAAATNDAATPPLPEQMLALLNGLAGASTAPAANAFAVATEAQPPALLRGVAVATASDPRGGNAAAPVLPTLPGAQIAAAAPTEGDATAAFAMAMGAAASADTKATDAPDATLDSTAIGDTTPTAPLSVSTMSSHPLRAAAAAVQANAPIPLDNGFDDGFSSRIAWLADQKVGHAEIRITPDHLGAIDVRLQIDGNRVNAEFNSAQPDVRHALESSLPRLKEMLGQQGLQLGQADVGQRQTQQQGSNGSASPSFASGDQRGDAASDAGWTRGPTVRASRGLLDEYA